jgi:hypothetical protein
MPLGAFVTGKVNIGLTEDLTTHLDMTQVHNCNSFEAANGFRSEVTEAIQTAEVTHAKVAYTGSINE